MQLDVSRTDWVIVGGVLAMVLALSIAIGVQHFPTVAAGVSLLILGSSLAVVQLRNPALGLMALMLSAVALPLHFGPNDDVSVTVLIAAGVCACWLIRLVLLRNNLPICVSSSSGMSILFLIVTGASTAIAQLPSLSLSVAPLRAQLGGLGIVALSVGLFLCTSFSINSVEQIKTFTWRFLLAGAFVLLMYRPQLGFVARRITEPSTIGSVFWSWLIAISAAQALFNGRLRPGWRAACWLLALASVADSFYQRSGWASGWLPPLIALGVLVMLRFPRFSLAATLIASPALGFGLLATADWVLRVESYSLLSRTAAWATLWKVILISPIVGLGPANYYYFTDLFSTLGWYVRFSSHQQYIDLVAQTGFIGLAVFTAFVWVELRILWRLQQQAPAGFERAFACGALAATVASLSSGMLADWLLPFVYNIGLKGFRSSLLFWLFLGLAIALERILKAERQQDELAVPDRSGQVLPSFQENSAPH
jgi:hypothetical protein